MIRNPPPYRYNPPRGVRVRVEARGNEKLYRKRFGLKNTGPSDRVRSLERAWRSGDLEAGWRLAQELVRQGHDEHDVLPILEQIPGAVRFGVVDCLTPDSSVGIERWDHPEFGSIFVRGYWNEVEDEVGQEWTCEVCGGPGHEPWHNCLAYLENPPPGRVTRKLSTSRPDCYPAAEVVYHAGGGRRAGLTPVQQRHEGRSHWWVRGPAGEVFDPTASQFNSPVPYERGRGRGFLTRRPSRRARAVARAAGIRLNPDVRRRELERQAAAGDPEAARALFMERKRAGELRFSLEGVLEAIRAMPGMTRREIAALWGKGRNQGGSLLAELKRVWLVYDDEAGRYWPGPPVLMSWDYGYGCYPVDALMKVANTIPTRFHRDKRSRRTLLRSLRGCLAFLSWANRELQTQLHEAERELLQTCVDDLQGMISHLEAGGLWDNYMRDTALTLRGNLEALWENLRRIPVYTWCPESERNPPPAPNQWVEPAFRARLVGLRVSLAEAANEAIEEFAWEGGGACDQVAQAMGDVLAEAGIDSLEGGHDGDDHAWLIAYDEGSRQACGIDVDPHVYEIGGGYSWERIEGARVEPEDVVLWKIPFEDIEPELWEESPLWNPPLSPQQWEDLVADLVNGHRTIAQASRHYNVSRQAISRHLRTRRPYAYRAIREGGVYGKSEPDDGRYFFVHACPGATCGEDIQRLRGSAQRIDRRTFARKLGPDQWKWIQRELGYDRDLPISQADWQIPYFRGAYRGVPAVFLVWSGYEFVFTLDGRLGPSEADR